MYDQRYTPFIFDMYVNEKLLTNLFSKCQEIQLNLGYTADQIKTINLKLNLKLVIL